MQVCKLEGSETYERGDGPSVYLFRQNLLLPAYHEFKQSHLCIIQLAYFRIVVEGGWLINQITGGRKGNGARISGNN
jgi:hypothetical protein